MKRGLIKESYNYYAIVTQDGRKEASDSKISGVLFYSGKGWNFPISKDAKLLIPMEVL